jgi:hypothetical protein
MVCLTLNICQNIFEKQLAMKPEIRIMANYQIGIPFIIIANLCNDNLNTFFLSLLFFVNNIPAINCLISSMSTSARVVLLELKTHAVVHMYLISHIIYGVNNYTSSERINLTFDKLY